MQRGPQITLIRSPLAAKKWRAVFSDGGHVDFGAAGYEDYTTHRDAARMARYVQRHGGVENGRRSTKEQWGIRGIRTPGFWSRWLLWSEPTLNGAKARISNTFGVQFV